MKKNLSSLAVFTGIITVLALLSSCAKEPAADIRDTQTASVTITQETQATEEPTEQLVGGDRDEAGIKAAFAKKYDKPVSEINLKDPQITSNFARGGVSFGAEPGAGGIFMAVKRDGEWILAFDGNGGADCNSLEEYGFPSAMLEGICY